LSEVDQSLQAKYQKALSQIQSMHKDNSEMKTQANAMKSEIQNWRAKC
jgi:FtsZ-binding cell division protein ZapB